MVEIHDEIESWYTDNPLPIEIHEDVGEIAQFLKQYPEQVESLLHLIAACRPCDLEGYLAALENLIKYFLAHDLLN